MSRQPTRIEPRFVERVWGRTDLSPLWGRQERRIGEVWFPLPGDFPLLVKFIFTDERLSVQVHPDDAFAREHENSRGKTEMWHILAAKPGATIALGFREPLDKQRLRESIADGSVEHLLNWVPVKTGDTLFAGAGTVHAIGGGICLCEIQQNSDVTYRLYDYGRPRELHVEKGIAVSQTVPADGRREFPVRCEHFETEMLAFDGVAESRVAGEHLLIVVEGTGTMENQPFAAGQVWHIPAGAEPIGLEAKGTARILRSACAA
jgi:mannose-6-phosphate isomerase